MIIYTGGVKKCLKILNQRRLIHTLVEEEQVMMFSFRFRAQGFGVRKITIIQ